MLVTAGQSVTRLFFLIWGSNVNYRSIATAFGTAIILAGCTQNIGTSSMPTYDTLRVSSNLPSAHTAASSLYVANSDPNDYFVPVFGAKRLNVKRTIKTGINQPLGILFNEN